MATSFPVPGGFKQVAPPRFNSGSQGPLLDRAQQIAYLNQLARANLDNKTQGGGGGNFLSRSVHWLTKPYPLLDRGVSDISSVLTGVADVSALAATTWYNALTTGHPDAGGTGAQIDRTINAVSDAFYNDPFPELRHPGRHPGLFAIDLLTAGSAAAARAEPISTASKVFTKKLREGETGSAASGGFSGGVTAPLPKGPTLRPNTGIFYGVEPKYPGQQGALFDVNRVERGFNPGASARASMADRQVRGVSTPEPLPGTQMTINDELGAQLLKRGNWNIADWQTALGIRSADETRSVMTQAIQEHGFPITKPGPFITKLREIMQRFPEQPTFADTPSGLALAHQEFARPPQLQLPGLESSLTQPVTVPEMLGGDVAPVVPTINRNQLTLGEPTGRVTRRYQTIAGNVHDITDMSNLVKLAEMKPTMATPQFMSGPVPYATPEQITELARASRKAELSGRPRGEPSMAPIARPPGEVLQQPLPTAGFQQPLTYEDRLRSLQVTTPEPRRYGLRLSEGALSYRQKLTNDLDRLKKQRKQAHGKLAGLKREGLLEQSQAMTKLIKKLDKQIAVRVAAKQDLRPFVVENTLTGERAGSRSAHQEVETALRAIDQLNKKQPLTAEELAQVPERSVAPLAPPRVAPPSVAPAAVAPAAPQVASAAGPAVSPFFGPPGVRTPVAEAPVPAADQARGAASAVAAPRVPREAAPVSEAANTRNVLHTPMKQAGFTRTHIAFDFETSAAEHIFENPSTKERIVFNDAGQVVDATRFDSKTSRIVDLPPARVDEITKAVAAEAARPKAPTPESIADDIAVANEDLILQKRQPPQPIIEGGPLPVPPTVPGGGPIAPPRQPPPVIQGGAEGTGQRSIVRGEKQLKIPGAAASVPEVARSLAWARKHPEFAEFVPDLEKALAQAKQVEEQAKKAPEVAPVRGQSGAASEGLGARELGLGPRAVRETLGLPNDAAGQATAQAISRTVHPKVAAWARKGGTLNELVGILRPSFGRVRAAELAKAIMQKVGPAAGAAGAGYLAAGPKGSAAALFLLPGGKVHPLLLQATKDAILSYRMPRARETMTVHYAVNKDTGEVVPYQQIADRFRLPGDNPRLQREMAAQNGWDIRQYEQISSGSALVNAWMKNVALPLLERYPESSPYSAVGKAMLTGRASFASKVRFEEAEVGRIAEAVAGLGLLPDPPKPGESAEAYAKRVVSAVDSMNMLAKITVLFMKPAYIPANLIGQIWLTGVDHAWSPFSLARAVGIQRELFSKDVRQTLTQAQRGDVQLYAHQRYDVTGAKPEELRYMRAAKIRALMHGGFIDAMLHERQLAGNPITGAIYRTYEATARQMGRLLDTPFRDNAFITEAIRQKYDSAAKIGELLDGLRPIQKGESMPDYLKYVTEIQPELVDIVRNANRNLIDYGRMSTKEKAVLRRIVFFYPWMKGATIYGGRMALEHPFQFAAFAHYGNVQMQLNQQQLGPLPSYGQGWTQVGSRNVPGIGEQPTIVNPTSSSVLGTPADVLNTVRHAFTGDPGNSLSDLLSPIMTLGAAAAFRIDPQTGQKYAGGTSALDAASQSAQHLVAPLSAYRKLDLAKRIESGQTPADSILLPLNQREVLGRFAFGVSPQTLNKKEAASRAFAEQVSTKGKRTQTLYKMQRKADEYLQEFKRVGMVPKGAKALPPPLRQAFQVRGERDAELSVARFNAGHVLNALESLQVELTLLVRKKVISAADARSRLAALASAPESQIEYQRRLLRNAYFGGHILSSYAASARARGANLPELR